MSPRQNRGTLLLATAIAALLTQAGCGGGDSPTPAALLSCDESMKTAFAPDANTTVVAVKAFRKGDPLTLGTPTAQTPLARTDLCMVKLNVGPGNPGPADAPSTSPGIGIEVWLPARDNWRRRLHNVGGGGWQGGAHGSATAVVNAGTASASPAEIAAIEGAVSASTDTGHPDAANGGSFAMNPDGTINAVLWQDFAQRSLHEMAVKSRALATAYFGTAPTHSYFEGASTGGRQAMMSAQANPEDYDGILAGMPAINWTRFLTAGLYPQIVFQRALAGAPLTTAQQDLVSNAAIAACDRVGGRHLGYVLDPSTCDYDPTTDPNVLCRSSGGTNATAACVTVAQAAVMNRIWYGMTADGTAPAPGVDNGWLQAASGRLPSGNQRWFGLSRGTSTYGAILAAFGLNGLASPNGPFPVGPDQVALELENPTISGFWFVNATGNGKDNWKGLGYAQLSHAFDRGVALQPLFGNINTDNPDLSAFKASGGKLLHWHGLDDELIMPQGSINYHSRVLRQMGGAANVDPFYRLFLVPGAGHTTPNGTANPAANPPIPAPGQLYRVLTDWVEKGIAPDSIVLNSPAAVPVAKSQPVCPYPKKATYDGSGDPFVAASYRCG